jgi:hypothetical protein
MTRNGKILLGAGLVLALGAAAAAAHRGEGWRHYKHHGPHHSFGFMGPFDGPMARVCRNNPAEQADHLLVRIEHRVKPTDAQKPQFETLKTALRTAAAKVAATCPEDQAGRTPTPQSSPSDETSGASAQRGVMVRLAETETRLAAMLDAVRTVRPAAESFYATLDDAQKTAVAEMTQRPWGKERGKKERWGKEHRRGDWNAPADLRGEQRNPANSDPSGARTAD